MFGSVPEEKAYFAPFAVFLGFLALDQLLGSIFEGLAGSWWWSEPQFWIFPLQTLVCGGMVWRWRRFYGLRWPAGAATAVAVAMGVAVLFIWIAPQLWLGFPARGHGFDPTFFGASGWAFDVTVVLRFLRLAVVVPLVEEIFWRGYLLRFFVAEPFTAVPIGTFSWRSCLIVTAGFCLEHQPADWPAAIAAGALYNLVAYRTHSLSACVLAHAATNLLLGIYVMRSGQWGFW
jgi:CAAX prenyl protease-like protein